jgi:hypothetical protein
MKATTTVKVKQVVWDELKISCPNCGHEDTLKADLPGMVEEVPMKVEFVLPDTLLIRDDAGKGVGSIDTARLLQESMGGTPE